MDRALPKDDEMANKEEENAQDEWVDEEFDEELDEDFDDDFAAADDAEEDYWWLPYTVLGVILMIGMLGFFGVFNRHLGFLVKGGNSQEAAKPATTAAAATPKPKRPAIPTPAKKPTKQLFGAAHILVSFKGSMRAKPDVKRTKEEAKKRADMITAKAKKDPSKFGELAKEFSDGPSGPRGGNLGMFPKGRMHPLFQAGVEKAKIGGVAGPVETPFGYHVIKRTK